MSDAELPPRYPDEVWKISWDWTPALDEGETITGQPTAVAADSSFTVGEVATVGNITTFKVSGGVAPSSPNIALLCQTSTGEAIGFNITARIRPR